MSPTRRRFPLAAVSICAIAVATPAVAAPRAAPKRGPAAAAKPAPAASVGLKHLSFAPERVSLTGRDPSQRFRIFGRYADGSVRDVTALAKIVRDGTAAVRVEKDVLTGVTDGAARLVASLGAAKGVLEITAREMASPGQWSFANEISPLLTKAGCNTGGCHGSPSGRGGFRLSLLGYEPDYDYDQIVKERNGTRINRQKPEASLVLQKPTMQAPHGGGMRFKVGSEYYKRLLAWLDAGAPKQPEFDPRIARLEVYPKEWTLLAPGATQPIIVMSVRDDGSTQDVTQYARYTTNDDSVVEVNDEGVLTASGKGETSVMIRYLGRVGVVNVRVPRDPVPASAYESFQPVNYIDQAVLARLKEVRIPPSGPASDAEFLRRAYIDTCGLLPTVEETLAFLDDRSPDKRARLVEQLLNRPEFADYWTLRWADLLRNNRTVKRDKGLQVFHRWIRESVRQNKPWDVFARELIVASGSPYRFGPANWYRLPDDELRSPEYPLYMGSATGQVFLGVRFDCARCHNHPFESWSQMDYYGLAAFFARTRSKDGVDEDEKIIYADIQGDSRHPRTNAIVEPRFPGADIATFTADEDRRAKLAAWITSPANYWFKRSISNRVWNNFFGRGIVHPVDDFRLTNPAANMPLLDALADKVVAYRFDLKLLMRDILNSRTYQTASAPNRWNADDRIYTSRIVPRRLYAEVLLDAIVQATGVPEDLGPYSRAVAAADNEIGRGGFLDLFGRSKREQACECERPEDTNVTMVLNLLNGPTVNGKLRHPEGRVARAVRGAKSPKAIIEEFYLAALCRRPTAKEEAAAMALFQRAPSPAEAAEDLLWSLMNMREFILNH